MEVHIKYDNNLLSLLVKDVEDIAILKAWCDGLIIKAEKSIFKLPVDQSEV